MCDRTHPTARRPHTMRSYSLYGRAVLQSAFSITCLRHGFIGYLYSLGHGKQNVGYKIRSLNKQNQVSGFPTLLIWFVGVPL